MNEQNNNVWDGGGLIRLGEYIIAAVVYFAGSPFVIAPTYVRKTNGWLVVSHNVNI